jgi:hypothetical protein
MLIRFLNRWCQMSEVSLNGGELLRKLGQAESIWLDARRLRPDPEGDWFLQNAVCLADSIREEVSMAKDGRLDVFRWAILRAIGEQISALPAPAGTELAEATTHSDGLKVPPERMAEFGEFEREQSIEPARAQRIIEAIRRELADQWLCGNGPPQIFEECFGQTIPRLKQEGVDYGEGVSFILAAANAMGLDVSADFVTEALDTHFRLSEAMEETE